MAQVNLALPPEVAEELKDICLRGNCLPRDVVLVALYKLGLKSAKPYAEIHPSKARKVPKPKEVSQSVTQPVD
jgi:hypothetical protein